MSVPRGSVRAVATVDDVRAIVADLPRAYEVVVNERIKFRVGRIVFAALSRDEELLGFGFDKEERVHLIATEPERYLAPLPQDERYNWLRARMSELDPQLLRELITDAWVMCVPKRVAAEYFA
jgi:hypothetical protein